jgi:TonB family protein
VFDLLLFGRSDFGFSQKSRLAPALLPMVRILVRGGIVFLRKAWVVLVVAGLAWATNGLKVQAQDSGNEIVRRAKIKVQVVYPDLARKMNITGTVKVAVVVSPNGIVKDAKVVGGHPVLASAALEAARKWRFEPAAVETTGVLDFTFEAHH